MDKIIDFHTHTFFSDGELGPGELVQRARTAGYKAIGLTDHVDASNMEMSLAGIIKFARETKEYLTDITVIPGVELTHIPPGQIKSLVEKARFLGAQIVILHGETICEPVEPGTNRAGLEAGVDILAHPGLITPEEVQLAVKNRVYLEISARKSHGMGNGNVVRLAAQYGAQLVLNSDSHSPGDLLSREWRRKCALGAGLTKDELKQINTNMELILAGINSPSSYV